MFAQDVDQDTGEDLNPSRTRQLGGENVDETAARNPDRPMSIPLVDVPDPEETGERYVHVFYLSVHKYS